MKVRNWPWIFIYFPICGAIQYIIITFIAMLFYPGGTFIDSSTEGYSFFMNFFSDLGNRISYSGHDNLISHILFSSTLTIFAFSNLFFMIGSNYIFKHMRNLCNSLVTISLLAIWSLLGVVFSPGDIYPTNHVFFAHNATFWTCIAFLIYSINIFLNTDYSNKYIIPFLTYVITLLVNAFIGIIKLEKNTFEGLLIQATIQKIFFYVWCTILIVISIQNIKIYTRMRSESNHNLLIIPTLEIKL